MSGLFSLLSSTSSALNAQSEAINVTGNNIANVNNPNYSRETVDFEPLTSVQTADGLQSTGMTVSVTQTRDSILDAMVRQEDSLTAGFNAQQNVLQQAQASLNESITNSSTSAATSGTDTTTVTGLSAAIDDFFNSFESLAASPSDPTQAASVVQQAGVLTDRFSQVDQNLAQVQDAATSSVAGNITTANGLLQQVAQLNGQIGSLETNSPGSAVQLRDQREGDLETLAGLMPISVTESTNGEDQVTTTDTSGQPVSLISNGTVTNSLSFSGGVISAGTTALGLSSGTMAGTLAAGTSVQDLRTSLDTLAGQIVTAVNSAYNPGGGGANFFAASGTTAATIAVDPSLTASTLQAGTGAPGDNSIALAVAAVANQTFSTAGGDLIDGTISQSYGNTVAGVGQALATVTTQANEQANVQTIVNNER